jgi:hypothetical protein
MSDDKKSADPNATPKTPEEEDRFQAALKAEHHQAKKGVTDAGEIVSSAGGELIDGRIADITDGDRPHHRKH